MKKTLLASIVGLAIASGAHAELTFDNPWNVYQAYGNVNVYSLPYNAITYNAYTGNTGTGPGNPYYVASSPGQIQNQIVIYTGASGTGVTTNIAGFDDAYLTPNGSQPTYASMSSGTGVVAPTNKIGINNNLTTTWDANLLNMKSFLDGGEAAFLFNNNETNTDQTLAIWAKFWITDPTNNLYGQYLYLSNQGQIFGFLPPPNVPSAYNPGDVGPLVDPSTQNTDYVMAGGNVCFNAGTLAQEICGSTPGEIVINHNLGANQVAYAGLSPLLGSYFDTLFQLNDSDLANYTFHLDLALGCDPRWLGDCDGKRIDNGYEQLFLVSTNSFVQIPEPRDLALVGLGLGLMAVFTSRRTKKAKLS